MSEYTTDQILDMIEKLGDPSKLDLSGKDLSGIDLNAETIRQKYEERGSPKSEKQPPWYSPDTKGINLQGAFFVRANFQNAHLGSANFKCAHLDGACLQDAALGSANLQRAMLAGANLQGATLWGTNLQKAKLWGANLHVASAWETDFQGADFLIAHLERVDLRDTKSLEGASFRDSYLDRTLFRWDQIRMVHEEKEGLYEAARLSYLALKVNFEEIGYYADARWAYLKERRMESKTLMGWRRLWNWSADFFTEYMQNPVRIIFRLVLSIFLFFALLYWVLQGLGPVEDHISQRGIETYLVFSARTIVTLAYGDLTPAGAGQVLAPLEGALGIAALGLLGYSIAKRIARD